MASFLLSRQVILVSTGVVSMALLLKVSVPLVLDFSYSQAPLIWVSLSSWCKPLYLFLLINCIIITIAASSRFHDHAHESNDHQEQQVQMPQPVEIISAEGLRRQDEFDYPPADKDVAAYKPVGEEKGCEVFVDKSVAEEVEVTGGSVEVDEFVISRSSWIPPKRTDSLEISPEILSSPEKPLVSARFGHRKPLKASPEAGRALGVARSKRHETLENTWKMITEGRPMPLTRHSKKLDTWENHGGQINVALEASPAKKSETFKDRTNYQLQPQSPATESPASGKLRKEPSLSQDELNRRVEAFIKKFNEEMRLQRLESLKQYNDMVGRGRR
uniref:DUF4408 domain-containing protein n=2 Tax=Rhizophora mucronata TaxID=61149 RepID=A0A2P2JAM4_RHIMU